MATNRDISLVIRARDEASRALNSIAKELDALASKQGEAGRSGSAFGASLATMVAQMAQFEKVSGLVAGAADRAEQAIQRTQQSITSNGQALAAVVQQLANARQAVARLEKSVVETRLSGGDTSALVGQLGGAKAAISELEAQQRRLRAAVTNGEQVLTDQQRGFAELASMANSATAAVESFGNAEQRAAAQARAAASADDADAAARMARARARFNGPTDDGTAPLRASDTAFAGQLREEEASAKVTAAEKAQAEAVAATNAQLVERARLQNAIAKITQPSSAGKASDTALAEQLRQEEAAAVAADAQAAAIQRLLDKADPLAAIQRRLAEETEVLRKGRAAGIVTDEQLAKAEAALAHQTQVTAQAIARAGKGEAGKIGMFGLKPYELTNLGYQVNDVFTQFASGTPVMQIIAQQGGQILQLIPNIGGALTKAFTNPSFLAAASVFIAIGLAIKEASSEADRLRQITGTLDALADGASHSKEALTASVKALREYRISAADALTTVKALVRDGVDDSRVVQFGRAAKDLADVMGGDLKAATQELGSAFTGNYDAIAKLDDKYNFLTAAQREHIRVLFDEGRAGEARVRALDIFSQKMGKAAGDMRGPWTDAVSHLGTAWDNFLEKLANSDLIRPLIRILNDLATALNLVAGATDNASGAVDRVSSKANERNDPLFTAPGLNGGAPATAAPTDTRANSADSLETKASNDTLHEMDLERTLQRLREDGAQAVDRLRRLNESFLTAAEQRRRIALAGELAATKAIGDERVKAQARANAMAEEQRKIEQERAQFDQASSSPAMITRRLIMQKERFAPQAYWDVNHFRVGFGSDTTTSPGGAISTVTAGTRTTMEAALRDLDRRIGEFQDAIKKLIGADRFNAFSAQQQAALTSLAYNYGTLARTADGHGAGIADVVRSGTTKQIADAIRALGSDNGGTNRARRNAEAALFEMPNAAIEADNQKQAEEAQQRQEKLNVTIKEANDERARQTGELEKQNKLTGEALVQEQIRAAGEKAVADLQRSVDQQNANLKPYEKKLELTQEQINATRQLAEEEARAQQAQSLAQAQTSDATRPMNDLTAERDAIRGQIDALRAVGDGAGADALLPRLAQINDQLRQAIESAIKFYEALDPKTDPLHRTREQIDATIASLKAAQTETVNWVNFMGVSGETIAHTFASSATSALDRFAQAVANGSNAFSALGDAFLSFASDFLRQIAQMIEQQIIFNLVSGILRAVSGSVAPNASLVPNIQGTMAANPGIFHTGGIAGQQATFTRSVSPAWFANALRYHSGGIAGLRPDEIPAILQKGEEVITANDPRHRNNGGAAGGAGQPKVDLKIVNTIDAGDMVSEGLATSSGQQSFLNFVRANRRAFKQAMS
jgi:GH24 family phage-related lysozyme (muramidase)